MIDIVYDGNYKIEIAGHANSGEMGKDLICSAASILTVTLDKLYAKLESLDMLESRTSIIEPGFARVSCKPKECYRCGVRLQTLAICEGYQILAEEEPEHVQYKTA